MLFASPNKNINDEIQMIRSRNMAKRVVRALGMEVQYIIIGKIRSSQIHAAESPFRLQILSLKDSSKAFNIPVTITDDQHFRVFEDGQTILFNQPFENHAGRFILTRTSILLSQFASNQFTVTYATGGTKSGPVGGQLICSSIRRV